MLPWRDGRRRRQKGKIELLSHWTMEGWDEQFSVELADHYMMKLKIGLIAIICRYMLPPQAYMAERSPFQLRGLLTAWNIFLAVFSIMGAARFDPCISCISHHSVTIIVTVLSPLLSQLLSPYCHNYCHHIVTIFIILFFQATDK